MEDNKQMTPEMSLEIISNMMNQSRKDIHQALGVHLMGWGLLVTVTSFLVGYLLNITHNGIWNSLWLVMVVIGVFISNLYKKKRIAPIPRSFMGEMIGKVWLCFGIFCSLYGFGIDAMDTFINYAIQIFHIQNTGIVIPGTPVILLLFGLVCSITGFILKDYVIVVCGVIAGFGGFVGSFIFQAASSLYAVSAVSFISLFIPGLRIYIKNKSVCYNR